MSARARILAAAGKFRPVEVKIADAGEPLFIRAMSVGGVARFQAIYAQDPARSSRAMIVECLCDEAGNRVLTADDESVVQEWPLTTVNELVAAITKATGLDEKSAASASGN